MKRQFEETSDGRRDDHQDWNTGHALRSAMYVESTGVHTRFCALNGEVFGDQELQATHVKHAANIYNGTFHPMIGEGVESTSYMQLYGRNRDSVMATNTDGTNASGIETTVASFRSNDDSTRL